MNPTAIYSKSGKGVQESSGKTSHLARADRAVLSAIDGRLTVKEVAERVGRSFDAKFEQLVQKLDSDGFIRQVSSGAAAAAAGGAARPAAGKPGGGGATLGEDLDFTVAMPAPVRAAPAAPPPPPAAAIGGEAAAKAQAAAFARAREEAEIKAQKERERLKAEAEAKFRAETEAKLRSEAELRAKEDAAARVKAEAEAKVKAAREAAVRAAAEAKAQAEAERKAREEAERKAREEAERVRKEAEELRQRLEAERKAREEAERKAKEEAERIRKEAEEKARREAEERARKEAEERARREAEEKARREAEEKARREAEEKARREAEELRQRLEAERQAREAAERKAKEEAERARKEAEEKARREAEQARREADELRQRLEAERREREQEAQQREHEAQQREREAQQRAREEREAQEKAREKAAREKAKEEAAAKAPARAATGDKFADSLMDDLDSFTQRDEEERKEREAAERKAKEAKEEAARRAREDEERAAREAEERKRRDEDDRRRKDEEARQAREREEAERREREEQARRAREEEERAQREAEERRRRREERAGAPAEDDDLVVSDEDLDMDDVKRDQAVLTKDARRSDRERAKREKQARREAKREAARKEKEAKRKEKEQDQARPAASVAPAYRPIRRRRGWGKPIAITLFLVLAAGIGVLHVMPIATAEYEQAAGQALGRPVKIGSGKLSLYKGVELHFKDVSVGEVKVAAVRAQPDIGSLFGPQKSFSLIELQGVSLPQQALGALFDARLKSPSFSVRELSARDLTLTGPVKLPTLQAELALGQDGAITSTSLRGAEGLQGKLVPKGDALAFDIVADSFPVPLLSDVWLSGFAMKGTATREGLQIQEWGGGSLDGGISGTANVRWGSNWIIDGVVTVRGINAAVFAPALLSEGKAEGTAKFSLDDPNPMNFLGRGRLEGTFAVHKGVLGSFDLSRAIQTGGRQAEGRTPFTGMNGRGVFDAGAVALRNVSFGAGAMNAGASADISAEGKLSGRIVADVTTSSQTLRATLNLGGTVKDPQVKN